MPAVVFGTSSALAVADASVATSSGGQPLDFAPPRWTAQAVGFEARCAIEDAVMTVLGEQHAARLRAERRAAQRYVYPHLISVSPWKRGAAAEGEKIAACVKDLSTAGIGFFHSVLLPHRLVVVELESRHYGRLSLVTSLLWCRYTRHGWYESGGWFVENLARGEQKGG